MPVRELDFARHNLHLDLHEVKRMFAMHTDNGCCYLLKQTLERLMADDLTEHLQAQWNQRTSARQDYRNGYRYRSLLTKGAKRWGPVIGGSPKVMVAVLIERHSKYPWAG